MNKHFDHLLYLYDYHVRNIAGVQARNGEDDYICGYADALGQVILDLGKIDGESSLGGPYKHEAYKRVCRFTSAAQYVKDYPDEIQRPAL